MSFLHLTRRLAPPAPPAAPLRPVVTVNKVRYCIGTGDQHKRESEGERR